MVLAASAVSSPVPRELLRANVPFVFLNREVDGVQLASTNGGEDRHLPLDGVFIAIGNDPRTDLVKDQLELTPEGTIKVDGRSSRTSIPGVFAAGDVIDPTYRQAITAAASGTVAALDAEHYLASLPADLLGRAKGDTRPGEAPASGATFTPDGTLVGQA